MVRVSHRRGRLMRSLARPFMTPPSADRPRTGCLAVASIWVWRVPQAPWRADEIRRVAQCRAATPPRLLTKHPLASIATARGKYCYLAETIQGLSTKMFDIKLGSPWISDEQRHNYIGSSL